MMEFRIEKASAEDADVIADVIFQVWEQTEKKEWFVPDDAEYERRILQSGQGLAYKAVETESGAVAGVFVAVFPGEEEHNLGWDIGFDREQVLKAAHMDSVAILPEYRGHRLQYRLMMEAEQELRNRGYEYLLCTVHPENRFSRDNILRQGYEVVMTKEKYGGYLRDILMKKLVKAIFFDIDGTLRDFETGRISGKTKLALERARSHGIRLFVATGRHVLEMEEGNLLEDLVFDGYVTLNGAFSYHAGGVIRDWPISREQVRRLMRLSEEHHFPCLIFEGHAMYINKVNRLVEEVQAGIATPVPEIRTFEPDSDRPVYQMVPYVDEAEMTELRKELPGCGFTRWHTGYAYDVTAAGVSKEKGIAAVLEYYGIDRRCCAAIGDGYNDISMIQYVGTGIAMGNGNDDLKAVSDYITSSIEEEGVAQAIDWLLGG